MVNCYCLIYGTRPEIVKIAPIIYELQKHNLCFFTIHTGQHFSPEMHQHFLDELNLPPPKYALPAGSPFDIEECIEQMLPILKQERPNIVLVQGDTNSTMAGALAAKAAGIKLAHIEAGLRGGEMFTLEEQNTARIARLADIHFAPSARDMANLRNEGVERNVFFVGNTIVDIVLQKAQEFNTRKLLDKYGLKHKAYILLTIHKAEMVDDPAKLARVIEIIKDLDQFRLPVLLPLHPRTKNRMEISELIFSESSHLRVLPPLRYREFLTLEKHALCVITDGGGIQEECCVLRTPVLVLKDSTQRPSVLDVKAAIICGLNRQKVLQEVADIKDGLSLRIWANPFGDGLAATRILTILEALALEGAERDFIAKTYNASLTKMEV